ncbi:MAG: hypothetical protein JNM82_13285, partial [Rhodocyclaceae bacterium]|nr:hypothetical protein [Rhodocyclaceae bacterium]
NMYRKLQEYNVLLGLLPASCTSDAANTDVSSDCQPSISAAQYRSLVSVEGDGTKSAEALLPGVTVPAGTKVVVQRRVKTSGTQASSNIFFLDNVCKTNAGPWFGALTPQGAKVATKYEVVENSETSGVRNGVAAGTAKTWALGVISLDNASTHKLNTKRRWVKIDGVSPDFPASAATQDASQREAVRTGR